MTSAPNGRYMKSTSGPAGRSAVVASPWTTGSGSAPGGGRRRSPRSSRRSAPAPGRAPPRRSPGTAPPTPRRAPGPSRTRGPRRRVAAGPAAGRSRGARRSAGSRRSSLRAGRCRRRAAAGIRARSRWCGCPRAGRTGAAGSTRCRSPARRRRGSGRAGAGHARGGAEQGSCGRLRIHAPILRHPVRARQPRDRLDRARRRGRSPGYGTEAVEAEPRGRRAAEHAVLLAGESSPRSAS